MRARTTWALGFAGAALAAGLVAIGCQTLKTAAEGKPIGNAIAKDLATGAKAVKQYRDANQGFTDSEEHYIGRSVSANLFASYSPVASEALGAYVSRVGAAVAQASDRPETFGGYRFQVLDADEVNAFAAPGGFIFVTRGMLALCEDEDMLAGVLAHEVGHVIARHGLAAIESEQKKKIIFMLGEDMVKDHFTPEELKALSKSLGDVVGGVKNLYNNGYGTGPEAEADRYAVTYAARAGYDPEGLHRFLLGMKKAANTAKGGMFASHPDVDDRLETVRETISETRLRPLAPATARAERFRAAVKG